MAKSNFRNGYGVYHKNFLVTINVTRRLGRGIVNILVDEKEQMKSERGLL
jgi:hypothetical protein